MTNLPWQEWNPGLDNDDMTIAEAFENMPTMDPSDISFMVKLLENPSSPIALKGAVTLEDHDCIHILLGRGMLKQDEAFILGFTMGSSKTITGLESSIYKFAVRYLYPESYKFRDREIAVFNTALELAKKCDVKPIYKIKFREYWHWKVADLRKLLKIDKELLKKAYKEEFLAYPDSEASRRLPIDENYKTDRAA